MDIYGLKPIRQKNIKQTVVFVLVEARVRNPIFEKPNDLGLTFSGQSCQHQCNRHCSKDPSYADTPLWEVTCSCRRMDDRTKQAFVYWRGEVLSLSSGRVYGLQLQLLQPTSWLYGKKSFVNQKTAFFLLGQLTRLTCTRSFCV